MKLLENVTANGSGPAVLWRPGGGVHAAWLEATGTFDGAVITLETQSPETGAWVEHVDTAFAAAGAKVIDLPGGINVRGKVAGAGASTSVSLNIQGG